MRYSTFTLWLKYLNRETGVGMMFLFVPFGLLMLLPLFIHLIHQWPFFVEGTTVQGQVVMKRQATRVIEMPPFASMSLFAHGGRRGPSYYLQYEYLDAAGKRHSQEEVVSFEMWRDAVVGTPILVQYVASDPARSQLAGVSSNYLQLAPFTIIGTLMVGISLWHGGRSIRRVGRQVRLIRDGEAVRGKIKDAVVERLGTRKTYVYTKMDYEYYTPEVMTGSAKIPLNMQENWVTGSELMVLIDRDDPTQHALDIFDARKEDRERMFGFPA